MGGSSVPSNTTQTTLLDPVRQKGLQDAAGYFNKWASTYNGPTYKGPLVAGRTQDWYTAQDMAHKMANRFAGGGLADLRGYAKMYMEPVSDSSGGSSAPDITAAPVTVDTSSAGYIPNSSAGISSLNSGPSNNITYGPQQATVVPYSSSVLPSVSAGNNFTGMSSNLGAQQVTLNPYTAALSDSPTVTTAQQSQSGLNNQTVVPYSSSVLPSVSANNGSANTTTPSDEATTRPLSLTTLPDTVNTGLASLKDSISGGATKDTISGGAGVDTTLGGAAKDSISGGATKDTISGGATKDSIASSAGTDTVATPVYTKPTYTPTPTTTNTQSPYLIAQGLAQKGVGGIYGIADKNWAPNQISNSYTNPDQITPGTITPDMWSATAMDTYMSPYTKGVVDIALREADRQRAIERLRENTAATQSGAFGGYRQGVVEAEGERNYNQRLGDIVNTGYQNAYNNAQTQFNADRASSVGAQTTNQANALQAYQNNQAALQQAAILDAQAGQNNITNTRQSVLDQLNALNLGISGATQLPAIETAYQQGSGVAQNALTTADASARSAMQAYYDAISKLSDANGNINLQKAQNLSNIMFGNNIPSGVQATVKT